MLLEPYAGWSLFKIDDFEFPISYLTDVPQDFTDAFLYGLSHGICSVTMDGEDKGDCLLVMNMFDCYTIQNKSNNYTLDNNIIIKRFEIDMHTLAEKFIKDIERHEEAWANWQLWEEPCLPYNLNKLKELLP